jgi:energy-coupling factor transport system permease protein
VIKGFKASEFHPLSWWVLGISLAICAASTSSLLGLLAICGFAILIIVAARENAPWSQSLRFYLTTASLVIAIRLIFRIIFNAVSSQDAILQLPDLSLNFGLAGNLHLFGGVSAATLEIALKDGLRLAAIIMSVGLANSLANPRRLLKNVPGALYEVATTLVIAINMAPQLIASAKRVRQARELRGLSKVNLIDGIVIPVLEDTLDQSLALAASMDARGFGRRGTLNRKQMFLTRFGSLSAVTLFAVGSYLLLTAGLPEATLICFLLGISGLVLALRVSGKGHVKTSFRRESWRSKDSLVAVIAAMLLVGTIGGFIR